MTLTFNFERKLSITQKLLVTFDAILHVKQTGTDIKTPIDQTPF